MFKGHTAETSDGELIFCICQIGEDHDEGAMEE